MRFSDFICRILFVSSALALTAGSVGAQNQSGVRHYELGAYLHQYDICGSEEPVGMIGWKSMKDAAGAQYLDTIGVNLNYLGVPWDGRPQWYEEAMENYATWLRDHTQGNVLLHTRPLQRLDWMPAPGPSPSHERVEFYPPRSCDIPTDASQRYADYISWVTRVFSEKLGSRLKYFVHAAEAQSRWEGKIDEYERSEDPACLEDGSDYDNLINAAYDSVKSVDPRISVFPSFGVEELYALSYEPSRDRYRTCMKGADRAQCAADNIARAAALKRDKFGVAFQPFSHAHGHFDPAEPLYDSRFLYDNAIEVFANGDWLGAGAMENEGIVVSETSWNATDVTVHRSGDPLSGVECWDHDYAPGSGPDYSEVDFYTAGGCTATSWPYNDPDDPMGSDQEQSDFFNHLILSAHENPHVELIAWWSVRDQIDTGITSRAGIAPDLNDQSCSSIAWDNTIHAFRHTIPKDIHEKYGTPYSSELADFGEASLKNWSTTGFLDYFGNDIGRSLKTDWQNVRSYTLFNEGTDPAQCFDAVDNDGDGLYNCDDPNCQNLAECMLLNKSEAAPALAYITSPDGRLQLTVKQMDLGTVVSRYQSGAILYYRLQRDGETVLDWSPLGLQLADADLAFNMQAVATNSEFVGDTYSLAHGKRKDHNYAARESLLAVQNANGDLMALRFRAFDDGIAFRYELPGSGTTTITNELSAFRLPAGSTGYLTEAVTASLFQPGYENPFVIQAAGMNADPVSDGFYFPALFRLPGSDTHVLLHEAGLDESYAGTRLDSNASDRVYQVRFPSPDEGDLLAPAQPTATLPAATPWRVVMVGALEDIVASNLVTHLSPALDPVFQGDTSWIKPGKAAWSWWSQDTQTPALQREYIDSAAEFGWEYVIVDANWSLWPDAETAVPELVQYAAQRGVDIVLWYNSGGPNNTITLEPRGRLDDAAAMQTEFAKLAAWGVAGVKVDFFRSDKQATIARYRDLLRSAAANHLHVVLHGSTPPRGWRREFPNLLTSESVLGAEHYKWSPGPEAGHNVRLVFTRNVVGAMDYTPLTFEAPLGLQGITYSHQLALSVVFESALQAFSDQADLNVDKGFRALFERFPFVRNFLKALPVAWDDTRLLEGDPTTHAVVAREHQGHWYIGGINGQWAPQDVTVNLERFVTVPEGQNVVYAANIIKDGTAADELLRTPLVVGPKGQIDITMAARGGFVIELIPVVVGDGCG